MCQISLAFTQRLAGDTAGAKVTAEQARNTLEPSTEINQTTRLCGIPVASLCDRGEKDSALKAAERAIVLLPSVKIAVGTWR